MANSLFIDIHILQTVPPSNINRDDTGSPKSARFGGVKRARVSSQAWKKATRDLFPNYLAEESIGIRTKYLVNLIAKKARRLDPQLAEQEALDKAKDVLKKYCERKKNKLDFESDDPYKLKTLFFAGLSEIEALAQCVLGQEDVGQLKKKMKNKKRVFWDSRDEIDIAMFGRMVATAPDLNVDASVQVAHAIGIGKMEPEFDYFTALDDRSPEDNAGAAMIETTEFTSSTMYRYANIDVLHLCENLGSAQVACRGVEAFLRSFILSMPTGKQNSFANRTLPAVIVIQLRNTQPVSLVNAFEKPVEACGGKSQVEIGCERLGDQAKAIDDAFGTSPQKTLVIVASPDAKALPDLMSGAVACNLGDAVNEVAFACSDFLAENGYQIEGED